MCLYKPQFDIVFLGFSNGLLDEYINKFIKQLFRNRLFSFLAIDLTDALAGALLVFAFVFMQLENGQKFYMCRTVLCFDLGHKIEEQ